MRLHFSLLSNSRREFVVAAALFCASAGGYAAITAALMDSGSRHGPVMHAGDAVAAITAVTASPGSKRSPVMHAGDAVAAITAATTSPGSKHSSWTHADDAITTTTTAAMIPRSKQSAVLRADGSAAAITDTFDESSSRHASAISQHPFPMLIAALPASTPEPPGAAAAAIVPPAPPIDACNDFTAWRADTAIGPARWKISATNGATIADAGTEVFDAVLISPRFNVPAIGLQLRWHQHTQLSWANTAGVLEIAIAGGDWTDFRQAGGRFLDGGYDSHAFASNPLGARPAWGGEDQEFETRAELPATLAAHSVRLRFRLGSSGTGDARPGWRLSQLSCGVGLVAGDASAERPLKNIVHNKLFFQERTIWRHPLLVDKSMAIQTRPRSAITIDKSPMTSTNSERNPATPRGFLPSQPDFVAS